MSYRNELQLRYKRDRSVREIVAFVSERWLRAFGSVNFLNVSVSFVCYRRGDWPAVPGKREPRGALQAPGARDHFHPDWRQVIVT